MSARHFAAFTFAIDGVLFAHQGAWEKEMSDGTIEECIDEFDGFVDTLTKYPEPVLALALRIHLAALLRALLESHRLTKAQVREFLRDMGREVFEEDGSTARGD
jgi:hypothetical protein